MKLSSFDPPIAVYAVKWRTKKRLVFFFFFYLRTISEVIQWTGKRFVPQLTILMLISSSGPFQLYPQDLLCFKKNLFIETLNISNLHLDSQPPMSCEFKDMRLSLVWCLYYSVLDFAVPCSLTVLLLKDTNHKIHSLSFVLHFSLMCHGNTELCSASSPMMMFLISSHETAVREYTSNRVF